MNLELFQELPNGAVVQNEHMFKRVDLWKKLGLEIVRDSFTYTFFFFFLRNTSLKNMRLKMPKSQETFKKHCQTDINKHNSKNYVF